MIEVYLQAWEPCGNTMCKTDLSGSKEHAGQDFLSLISAETLQSGIASERANMRPSSFVSQVLLIGFLSHRFFPFLV